MSSTRLEFATQLARQAGGLLRTGYASDFSIEHKGAVDLVTDYDRRSEVLLIQSIQKEFPEDAILSEESGVLGQGAYTWVLDPLDGTTNFAHRLRHFSVSIACASNGRPFLGVVYDPMADELFTASEGEGAWLGSRRLQVSDGDQLDQSLLATGFPYDLRTNPNNNINHFAHLALRARAVRRLGSAALELAYLAAGRLDGFWELRLNPWDWAAGRVIVEEAGGTVTLSLTEARQLDEPADIAASNGHIHAELIEALSFEAHLTSS